MVKHRVQASVDISDVAKKAAKSEYTDYLIYKKLGERRKKIASPLGKLATSEYNHYQFWGKYCNIKEIKPNTLRVYLIIFLSYVLGNTFAIKFMENHESDVVALYRQVEGAVRPEDLEAYEQMIEDEEEHEKSFAEETKSSYLKYISFIILGLADAIVEISGIHAGSLGIYKSTEITGLAGIVAGASASIAMASAAYAQAKQGFQGKASVSAIFTGVSYFINAVVLASPYFLTRSQPVALAVSVILAVLIIAFTSYYNSVISGSSFLRDFGELAGIMLGATAALYLFGLALSSVTGI